MLNDTLTRAGRQIKMVPYASAEPATWEEETKTCQNLITEYRIDLYTALVGNVLEPQTKLIGGAPPAPLHQSA